MKQGSDVPAFVQYIPCTTCNGSGWKRERGGYSMITCPTCKGEKKLPMWTGDENGKFLKRIDYNEQNAEKKRENRR